MNHWIENAIFYHIYPLGACGAPQVNDHDSQPVSRIAAIHGWLDHIQALGANAIYLGPVFESTHHGYDTANYYEVDRRLGTCADMAALSSAIHARGMHLVLDGVFNHVGRDFWAFKDLQTNREGSPYRDWFYDIRFGETSRYGDPFSYAGWNGHTNLVKLNLENPAVRQHLFGAVEMWVRNLGIDGIRLDAADCLSFSFLEVLSSFRNQLKPDLWLMGEVIHGDYRQWVAPNRMDSVANYELYKGLYSSHNDQNYYEVAYALNRQFGPGGIYRNIKLYNFVDNHDVSRIASVLKDKAHLYPLHLLLFTLPGVPALYYGSEFGIPGFKDSHSDDPLRPVFDLHTMENNVPHPDLPGFIRQLAAIRRSSPALLYGDYTQMHVSAQQFAFSRRKDGDDVLVAVNSAPEQATLRLPGFGQARAVDLLDASEPVTISNGSLDLQLPASYGRIIRIERN
jgi:cyclomaltodextrinase